ncbi:MAG: diguanylate cyclase [Rhodoferax sp.]|nr:diguanylate cyclase [Rhodoferax sp.]
MSLQDVSTLFDLLPIGAYRSSPEGKILRLNAALLRLNGYASEAECFSDDKEIARDSYVVPERRAEFRAILEAQGQISDFVSEMYRLRTSERMWVREHAHLVRDAQGQSLYYEGTIEDITEERNTVIALQKSGELLHNLLQTIPDRVWLKDLDGVYLSCNEAFASGLGAKPEAVIGTRDIDWVDPSEVAHILNNDRLALQTGSPVVTEEPMLGPHYPPGKLYEIIKTPMRDEDARITGVVGVARDIHQRKMTEALLYSTQAELEATLKALPDMVLECSAEGYYRSVHSHDPSDLVMPVALQIGHHIDEVLPKDAAHTCLEAIHEALTTGQSFGKTYTLSLPAGRRWYELSVVRKPTAPGAEIRLIAIARNITKRKAAEEAILHLAFHDSLTNLPNRRLLSDRLQTAMTASQRNKMLGALLFVDLDHFKELNDTFGHDIGDQLLAEVAQRLQNSVRGIDTVARLGGDEFVVLVQDLSAVRAEARDHAATVGRKILASLGQGYTLGDHRHQLTPSIGATLFEGQAHTPAEVLRQADQAMYSAKTKGRNTLCFYGEG